MGANTDGEARALLIQIFTRARWGGRLLAADNGYAGLGPSGLEMLYGAAKRAIRVMLNKIGSLNNPTLLSALNNLAGQKLLK